MTKKRIMIITAVAALAAGILLVREWKRYYNDLFGLGE